MTDIRTALIQALLLDDDTPQAAEELCGAWEETIAGKPLWAWAQHWSRHSYARSKAISLGYTVSGEEMRRRLHALTADLGVAEVLCIEREMSRVWLYEYPGGEWLAFEIPKLAHSDEWTADQWRQLSEHPQGHARSIEKALTAEATRTP